MKNNLHKNKKWLILIVVISCFWAADLAWASSLGLKLDKKDIDIKEKAVLNLNLTSEEHINAIELVINFPDELLEVKDINIGSSIVNNWIEKPYLRSSGEIAMAGIIPGGFLGENGKIISVDLIGKDKGVADIYLSGVEALKNDGLGSNVFIQASPVQIQIHNWIFDEKYKTIINDTEKPEDFELEIARDKNIFQNKWFVAFNTQDKGLGIDHYEVLEKRFGSWFKNNWARVESPYLLKDQMLKSTIFIKAVDKAGNERVVISEPKNKITIFDYWYNLILILLIAWYGFYYFKNYKK